MGIKIGIVGLRFGGEFPPIYRDHPDIEQVAVCDRDEDLLKRYAARFGFARTYTDYEAMLESDLDAVHIVTGIPGHAAMSVQALRAGKHCACTVPMGTTLDELYAVLEAQRAGGKSYMMMETAIYTFQCLYARQLAESGRMGRIQFLRGTHFQDMEGWPAYWMGLPPMHYATHAVAPLMHISGTHGLRVRALGSGVMREELRAPYGNPFPIEHAILELSAPGLVAEVTRSLFHTAVEYVEGFSVFGEKMSFEWNYENETPRVYAFDESAEAMNHSGRRVATTPAECVDRRELLPEPIRKYTRSHTVLDAANPHQSIRQGGGHHGSHPHMVHEFVRSILEKRPAISGPVKAARWTAAGICAHQSALRGGEPVDIPDFSR